MQKRENSFTFLRFLAAIGVVMGHVAWHMEKPAFGYDASPLKPFFHMGVPFFFVLSAFLLYPSYSRFRQKGGSIKGFLIKRYIRIAPSVYLYAVTAVIVLSLIGVITIDTFTEKGFLVWATSNLVLFPVYNPEAFSGVGVGSLNGSLWTISALVMFYLAIPIIYYLEQKIGFKKMIIALFGLSVITIVTQMGLRTLESQFLGNLFWVTFFPYLIFFAFGILWSKVWSSKFNGKSLFVISIIIVILTKTDGFYLNQNIGDFSNLIWAAPYSFAIIWFGYNAPRFFHKFNKIEDIGMGIYIWHMFVINIALYTVPELVEVTPNYLAHLLIIGITFALAYLSRVFVEKPSVKIFDVKIKMENKTLEKAQ